MSNAGWLDSYIAERDRDPEFVLEGVLLRVNERICEIMDRKGITRAELARRLDVKPPYITKLLDGEANLTLRSLVNVAVSLDEGLDVFVPSSVTEERARASAAVRREDEQRRVEVDRDKWCRDLDDRRARTEAPASETHGEFALTA